MPANVSLHIFNNQSQPKKTANVELVQNAPSSHVLGVRGQATVETNVKIVGKQAAEGGIRRGCTRPVVKGGILDGDYLCTSNHDNPSPCNQTTCT